MENTRKSIVKSAVNKSSDVRMFRYLRPILIIVALCLPFLDTAVLAQTRDGRQLVTAEIISDAITTEKPFVVGIRFTIQPEWYLYWKNPGDAGLPIDVQWELPPGWTAADVQLPIPSKFVYGDITAFGYKHEVVLLTSITPAGDSKGLIKARLDWLVCRESCLRGGTTATLDVSKRSSEQRAQASSLLSAFRSRLPGTQKESGVLIQKSRLSHTGEQWTLNISLTGGVTNEINDFYPEVVEGLVMNLQRISVLKGELTIAFDRQGESTHTANLRGLLVTTDSAFEFEIPVQLSSQ
jgi:thiol:disulfide interchange protein DsbD